MMGEVALRYPEHGLVVSTGTWPGSDASDARFRQTIDRVAVGAKRLRTLNGLVRWARRAAALARRTEPAFAWCDEVKPAGYPAAWLHARRGIPVGVLAHGADRLLLQAKVRRSRFKRWTARRIFEGCAVVVANSRWTAGLARDVLESLGCPALAADVRVVHLGTTPSHFRPGIDPLPVRRKHGLEGGPWLLTVARLDFHKGIDTVIRALPAIRAAVPGARYAVAGVGSRRDTLDALVAELGLRDAVRLLGFVPDAELPALYNAADVFVLASRRHDLLVEGFGIACVEAAACGLAVIGSRSGGIPEAIREGETGLLVDPEDPAALAAAAVRVLEDDALRRRLGAAGRPVLAAARGQPGAPASRPVRALRQREAGGVPGPLGARALAHPLRHFFPRRRSAERAAQDPTLASQTPHGARHFRRGRGPDDQQRLDPRPRALTARRLGPRGARPPTTCRAPGHGPDLLPARYRCERAARAVRPARQQHPLARDGRPPGEAQGHGHGDRGAAGHPRARSGRVLRGRRDGSRPRAAGEAGTRAPAGRPCALSRRRRRSGPAGVLQSRVGVRRRLAARRAAGRGGVRDLVGGSLRVRPAGGGR